MKYYTIITLISICVLSGCSHGQSGNHAVLQQTEKIIDEDPNKAMQMLYEMENAQNKPGEDGDKSDIEHSRLDTKEDSALFGLLYIAAIHKIGLEIRNDSLITNSVDYYRQQKEHTRLAKALLHLGITHQSNGRWKDAVTCLKEAEGMIDDCNDKVFCYDVYDAIGNLNAAANCRELMLTYYQRALASATAMNSNSRKAASLNKLIRAYIHQSQLDSAKVYVEQAKPLLSSVERQVQSDLLVSFGCNALEEKDTVKGKQYLLQALEVFPNDYGAKRMGDIMEAEGKMKEATDYWFESLNTDHIQVRIEAYEKLVQYYRDREEWRALDLSEHLNRLYQSIRVNDKAETIAAMQKEYDHRVVQHRLYRNVLLLLGASLVLLIIIGSFYYYHRRKMKDYNKVLSRIEDLQNELKETQKEPETPIDLSLMDTLLSDETVHYFHRLADRGKTPDDESWKDLYDLMNRILPDFLGIVNRNGLLSERDIRICMLIKLRFIPTEIATLIGESPQTITNRRARLLGKVFGEKGGAKDFDARIQTLQE